MFKETIAAIAASPAQSKSRANLHRWLGRFWGWSFFLLTIGLFAGALWITHWLWVYVYGPPFSWTFLSLFLRCLTPLLIYMLWRRWWKTNQLLATNVAALAGAYVRSYKNFVEPPASEIDSPTSRMLKDIRIERNQNK